MLKELVVRTTSFKMFETGPKEVLTNRLVLSDEF